MLVLLKNRQKSENVHSPALVLSPGTALIVLSTIRGWHLLKSSSVMLLDDMWCEPSMLLERCCRGVLMAVLLPVLLLGCDCGGGNLSGGRQ